MTSKKTKKISFDDLLLLAGQFLYEYIWAKEDEPDAETSFYKLRRWREEWYLYEQGSYIKVADDTVRQTVTAYMQQYAKDLFWREKTRINVTRNFVTNVISNIEAMVHIKETQELNTFLDRVDRGRFLSLKNGLLNLDTRELLSPTPNYFTAVCLPYNYDPDAECPQFDLFLQDVMLGKQDYIDLLQEFIGYLFRPDLREHKFLLCVGEGANGKTTLFDVIRALVGTENCSEAPISCFADRFALYGTIGKIANLTHESSSVLEDSAENVLKSYVSGDRMTVDRKYKQPVEVTPTAKLLISTNNLPRFTDRSQAIWRRILLVPFDLTLEENLQNKDMANRLKEELSGILNWALIGLDRLNEKGFTVPVGNKELMENYRRDADPSRAFLLDNYESSLNGAYVPCAEIYKDYKQFCDSNGCHAMNERTFGQHVRRIFPRVERQRIGTRDNREYVYMGLVSYVS